MHSLHDEHQLLTLSEAADLGYGGYSTLRKLIAENRLPAVRLGRRVKVRRADLEALTHPTGVDPLERYVKELVDAAPRLSDEQIARLRFALGGDQR